jgi:hypothetical protein
MFDKWLGRPFRRVLKDDILLLHKQVVSMNRGEFSLNGKTYNSECHVNSWVIGNLVLFKWLLVQEMLDVVHYSSCLFSTTS